MGRALIIVVEAEEMENQSRTLTIQWRDGDTVKKESQKALVLSPILARHKLESPERNLN